MVFCKADMQPVCHLLLYCRYDVADLLVGKNFRAGGAPGRVLGTDMRSAITWYLG